MPSRWTLRRVSSSSVAIAASSRSESWPGGPPGDREVDVGVAEEVERLDEQGEVLASFLGADRHDERETVEPGDRGRGFGRGGRGRGRTEVNGDDAVRSEESARSPGGRLRADVDPCPRRRCTSELVPGPADDRAGVPRMVEEPAVVDRDHGRELRGRGDVVGSVDDVDPTEPAVGARHPDAGPQVRGDDARERETSVAVVRGRPGAHEVGGQGDVRAPFELADQSGDGDADAGSVAVQRADVDRDVHRWVVRRIHQRRHRTVP
jgi:hypothetical protein